MTLPILTYSGTDYTAVSGLREIFWFGRSKCQSDDGVESFCYNDEWITKEGWEQKLREFVLSHRPSADTKEVSKELLWLYVPDYSQNGVITSIKKIKDIGYDYNQKKIISKDTMFWEQNEECSGFVISSKDCEFRTKEMILVNYTPLECLTGEMTNCEDLVAYARYNNQQAVRQEAWL